MTLSFKYRKEIFENKPKYFPKIPVVLYNKGNSIQTTSLLDSGATHIFVPKEIAELLELEFKNHEMAISWTGEFKVWESSIGFAVGKGSQTFRKTMPCLIPDESSLSDEVIFGRTFFQFFEITFNEKKLFTQLKLL